MSTTDLQIRDIQVGDRLPEQDIELTTSLIVGGALASRDFTPVHHDKAAAQATGSDVAGVQLAEGQVALASGDPRRAERLQIKAFEAYRDKFNCHLLEGYGLTETAPVTNWSTPEENRVHAVGKAIPGVTNLIVDENNNTLGADEEGEILITGPNVMNGYWNLAEQTDEVFTDVQAPGKGTVKAFRTGDIGKLDAEGYLYITGVGAQGSDVVYQWSSRDLGFEFPLVDQAGRQLAKKARRSTGTQLTTTAA